MHPRRRSITAPIIAAIMAVLVLAALWGDRQTREWEIAEQIQRGSSSQSRAAAHPAPTEVVHPAERSSIQPDLAKDTARPTKPLTAEEQEIQAELTRMRRRYGRFIQTQHLAAETADRMLVLLVERHLLGEDQIPNRATQTQAEISDELTLLLGADGKTAFDQYDNDLTFQAELVLPAVRAFSKDNVPLSETDTDALAALVSANSRGTLISQSFGLEATVDWAAVSAQAATILTPTQLAELSTRVPSLNEAQEQNITRLKQLHPN